MSIIVDDLFDRFGTDQSIGTAFVYCNFKCHDEQTLEGLLSSLLKQLAQRRPLLPEGLKSLYSQHHGRGRPSYTELSKVLQVVASSYSRVYLLVDALDECQVSGGCRSKFISEILSSQTDTTSLLATSRFIPEIAEKFKGSPLKEICARNEDVTRYLEDNFNQLPRFVIHDAELQNEIKASIIDTVDGM